nr:phosphoribosylformylglycinamidine synthase [Candidatus Desulfacyla euxinica]
FTVSSVIREITKCVSMDAKFPGDIVYILGKTRNELGGSELYQMMNYVGLNVPKVDAKALWPQYLALHRAMSEDLVSSCHAVSRGGLAVHFALVAMAGELGIEIDLPLFPGSAGLAPSQTLYSESCGRFIITVDPRKKELFEDIFTGMNMEKVGTITESPLLIIRSYNGEPIIEEDIFRLKDSWKRPFGELI